MKQLRKTEWRRGYPIKKFLALCVWGVMAIAGCAGTLSCPDNIPSLAACVLALAGAVLTLPRLLRYYRTTYHSLPALNRRLTKEEQEELLENENFETIIELKSESLRWTDFAESEHWLRINGRYIPKELAILGGAKVTFNIMNRDTTPVVFLYATGDVVKIDLEFRSVPGKSGNLMHTSGPAVAFFRNRQTGQRRKNCGRSVLRKCRHI